MSTLLRLKFMLYYVWRSLPMLVAFFTYVNKYTSAGKFLF